MMACLSTKRVCARAVQEKLMCQFLSKRNNFHQTHSRRFLATTATAPRYSSSHESSSSTGNATRIILDRRFSTSSFFRSLNDSSSSSASSSSGGSSSALPINQIKQSAMAATLAANAAAVPIITTTTPAAISTRDFSSAHTQQPGPKQDYQVDPYLLLDDELKYIYHDMRQFLSMATDLEELDTISTYYFNGEGKALRPMVVLLMSKAINYHLQIENNSDLLEKQRQVAMIVEMTHCCSLIHDDVIDASDSRRGRPSVNVLWNHRRVTMAGDYVLAVTSILIARLRNSDVTITLNQILTDLVQGELMQLGAKETENERFAHYFMKTFRKTASLIANSLKATAQLSGADEHLIDLAYQYGRNIGLAFQFVDDLLDFVSSTEALGKPAAADLKLGLATAPVLFACEKYPELNPMIMRRFQEKGDVEKAFELVHKSQGLEQTRLLAHKHCIEAMRLAQELAESPYQKGLMVVADLVLNRLK